MRVLALVTSPPDVSPGQRYRIEQWGQWLGEHGFDIRYEPFLTEELNSLLYRSGATARKLRLILEALARRARLVDSVRDYDLVYLYREAALIGPGLFERRIARSGVPIVFDFDDAIFVRYRSPANGLLSLLKFPSKTGGICSLASHVIAGNRYLADYAGRFNPRVSIVPSTIDTDWYVPRASREEPEVPVIGWTGSFSTVQHIDRLRDVLGRLAQRVRFRMRVIGAANYSIDGLDVERVPWRSATEVNDLAPVDVGIMPLPDDPWSRGKCGMKALQYMALGIPPVCSPVGVNRELIEDGKNGFLAASDDEWIEKLVTLLSSADLRRRIGAAARETVEVHYSKRVQAPRVACILGEAVSATHPRLQATASTSV